MGNWTWVYSTWRFLKRVNLMRESELAKGKRTPAQSLTKLIGMLLQKWAKGVGFSTSIA